MSKTTGQPLLSAKLTFLVTITHHYRNYQERSRRRKIRHLYYGFRYWGKAREKELIERIDKGE